MGKALARSSKLPNGPINKGDRRLGSLELKRLRIWRSYDWISERFRHDAKRSPSRWACPCTTWRLSTSIQRAGTRGRYCIWGDHFSRETMILSDACRGAENSDLWLITDAVYRYGRRHAGKTKNPSSSMMGLGESDWLNLLDRISNLNEHGVGGSRNVDELGGSIIDAIREYDVVGEERKRMMMSFVEAVLVNEQRDSIYNAFVNPSKGSANAFLDACVISPARTGFYLMLNFLLKLITFNVLNLIGYEAYRILVFKMFVPALLTVFLSNGVLGHVFENGSFMQKLLSEKAGSETIGSILERSAMVASEVRRSKNYAANDTATLYGGLVESGATSTYKPCRTLQEQ